MISLKDSISIQDIDIIDEDLSDKLSEAITAEDLTTVDEGILTGIIGGVLGATAGSAIMKAVCRTLGVMPDGALYKALTSKAVCAAVGYTVGK